MSNRDIVENWERSYFKGVVTDLFGRVFLLLNYTPQSGYGKQKQALQPYRKTHSEAVGRTRARRENTGARPQPEQERADATC